MTTAIHDSSGQAHPYWYEWFVGLIEVVRLLNPDEQVVSVAFQVSSIRAWDDVVVLLTRGRRCYQVKHSRDGKNLTFGSLVHRSQNEKPLLESLFDGWKESGLNDSLTDTILYTNREAGSIWATTDSGVRRPPLVAFWTWLKEELTKVNSLSEFAIPLDYRDGWNEWINCFPGAAESEVLSFLRRLAIRTKEDDLDGLEDRIRRSLADAFGVSIEKGAPLFDALLRSLRTWTTGHPGVTVEDLCTVLALPPEPRDLAQAPPPPTPFFPTRIPIASQLESDLQSSTELPVVFLCGEPGSGKTSVVSWLANRRTEFAFQGIIGVRFFCFEPIRPEQPVIAPDASRVTPKELWFSLLAQLRKGLKGRLHELSVPIRNTFLDWVEARGHVLRLANILGNESGRPFVITIDGIDHAARASQTQPLQTAEFFASLPAPDELDATSVRLFIAGQPPEYYRDQYPVWLRSVHPKVRRVDLPRLEQDDVHALLVMSSTAIQLTQITDAARLIHQLSNGNTLAIVFAVAESEYTNDLDALRSRLEQRRLVDGLEAYYESIWSHALRSRPSLSSYMAGAISVNRTGVTADQLAASFRSWDLPVPEWNRILLELGPLLTEVSSTYQIRHNDIRVFLVAKYQSCQLSERRAIAGQLADYYVSRDCSRLAAHIHLFDLLELANRASDLPELFTTDWVIEGAVLGLDLDQLRDEGEKATRALLDRKSWSSVVSVGCALHTLARLSYEDDFSPRQQIEIDLPPFLPTEASVTPISEWTADEFRQLTFDAIELVNGDAPERARGLLTRWLDKLTVNAVVRMLPEPESHLAAWNQGDEPRLGQFLQGDFERLGYLSGKLSWKIACKVNRKTPNIEVDAVFAFDKGFVDAVTSPPRSDSRKEVFAVHSPIFLSNWEQAIRNAVAHNRWPLVAELLLALEHSELSKTFCSEATWFALRSGAYHTQPQWLSPLESPAYGLEGTSQYSPHGSIYYESYVDVCRALGWTRPGFDPLEIAESVFAAFKSDGDCEDSAAVKLLFRIAAVLGRIEGQVESNGWQQAAMAVSPAVVGQLLTAAWGDVIVTASYRFDARKLAADLAAELSDKCAQLGESHVRASFEAAAPYAEQLVLGHRVHGVWNAILRYGRIDLLHTWTNHFLAPDGEVWNWSHHSARETVAILAPLATSIGQIELAENASRRAKWLCIPYQDRKEYSFEKISEWFLRLAKLDPSTVKTLGWQLWQLCMLCTARDGGNDYESRIRAGVSAAAFRCGAEVWWNWISSSLPQANDSSWHYHTRDSLVEGATVAISQGAVLTSSDVGAIFAIAVSFSYWFDRSDNIHLTRLHDALAGCISDESRNDFIVLRRYIVDIPAGTAHDENEADPHSTDVRDDGPSMNSRTDDDFWEEVRALGTRIDDEEGYWNYYDAILDVAFERAVLHGPEALQSGLREMLNMHARWIFGDKPIAEIPWTSFPAVSTNPNWDTVAVSLLKVLLRSYSAEVISAAVAGMQCLVDHKPDMVRELFAAIRDEWSIRWLLNTAECWSILYPTAVAQIRPHLLQAINGSDLDLSLQAWIVLTLNCDRLDEPRVPFPIPSDPTLTIDDVNRIETQLLEVPPTIQGSARYANRFSAAKGLLEYCETFGFTFEKLEGLVARGLDTFRDTSDIPLLLRGPHRYDDFAIIPVEAEKAVGHTVRQILSSQWCTQEMIADLCQALLPNEDSWICRNRPIAVNETDWIAGPQYGEELTAHARNSSMQDATLNLRVKDGWRVFAARAVDFTDEEDFVWRYWFESCRESLLIRPTRVPTCPGGRTFVWWIGAPRELHFDYFVSGMFIGGRHRLCHSTFEIRPPGFWRDGFGWTPNVTNPFEWLFEGEVVAKYERLYRAPSSSARGPSYRRPFIDRWVVSNSGFEMATNIIGALSAKSYFEVLNFRTD